ncbi:MAG: DUF2007 domain-containing protein [Deltaproteobacteria bacterium]|jgi:hypothetical protein|nr:DUF2007 domain-containing protein [Deltaproteobacteria bacterium]MBN2845026.1 DUF2007 domain-containing protein [Deltaproteobacteria bacterium]
MEDDKWVVVYVASGMINANIIVGRLESEEIPVKLRYDVVGAIYGLTLDGLGEVKVMVPSRYVLRAEEILSHFYEDKDIDWEE